MASALNKRQQARNERTLQELIKTVPGNGVCADCGARNPGWASWSLGIFLCMRCAALHRKLGTHISKVKSLSMDKWDNAQVDNMKRIGNVESNKAYNPRNIKPQIPIDIDEVDSAMERFIRQKYEQRTFMNDSRPGTRSNTGSSSSVEDRPPPLPPKPTKRFGFGLQKASTFPKNVTPPVSPGLSGFSGQDTSPPRVNKPSRVFGSNVNTSGDGLESKLATLRDMGFPDEKRNSTVLRGLNGNLDRAVEALIRLGEQNPTKSRGSTPTPPAKGGVNLNGLMIEKSHTMPAATTSANPFDALDAVAPLPQQQLQPAPIQTQQPPFGGPSAQPTSPSNPYNPFLSQAQGGQFQHGFPQQQQYLAQQQNPFVQQPHSLEQSFQGLQLSHQQPQQPLFPNRTGGYGQHQSPQYPQTNPFHQSFTPPPMPQLPQQYSSFYQPQQQQYPSMSSPTSPGNPFLKSTRSQMFTPTNTLNSNPFGQPPAQPQPQPQQPQQGQNPFMMQQQQNTQTPFAQASNPFQSQQTGYQQPSYQQSQAGFDKNSILALYNYPQLAPQRSEQSQTPPAPAQAVAPAAPTPGHLNPFASAQAPQTAQQQPTSFSAQQQGVRHVSNESVDFAGLMGGRHSPDAFSGLSSSFRR
ncbi:ArfGap-domain-containing protein [Trematosphaeria pertusa]|uniref:ArfGap-domain-containing protein n=1 Tax=Trematosphaeria pertusa TaxID=390896 RepID=A0A6A6IYD1_9PLEO|nr:ArfGap-domain-containing protein [Trematosphaeria pertusa]KAF2255414.1 ArfGap-domain-containing protein [Trematosphaeria pertusa]